MFPCQRYHLLKPSQSIKLENVGLKHTLKVWTTLQKRLMEPESMLMIVGNRISTLSLGEWADKCLLINQLIEGTQCKSLSQLQEQLDLLSEDW